MNSDKKEKDILYKKESYDIMDACFEVYKELGNGYLESVYQECLELEFRRKNIPYVAQPVLKLTYKDVILNQTYKPDFVCYNSIIIELKAISNLLEEHTAQLLNYLNATKLKLGLLINFGHYPLLEYKRLLV